MHIEVKAAENKNKEYSKKEEKLKVWKDASISD